MNDPFLPHPDVPPRFSLPASPTSPDGGRESPRASPFAHASDPLLLTKVTVPPVRDRLLPRSAPLALLESSVPLMLVSAGAGYGKTTLLSSFAQTQPGQVAWLTLSELENDPLRFWTYVLLALRTAVPSFGEQAWAWFPAMDVAILPRLLTALLNNLAECKHTLTLILDDYQVIQEPSIHHSLSFLLAHAPACFRLCLASRTDPALPLARLRARGQVVEIRETQLRLSLREAEQFLGQTMGLMLSQADVQALTRRTEGWIAGLQLAALALRAQTLPSQGVHRISGCHQYLVEYVQEDILANVAPPTQTFLRQVSILSQMTASLCQMVTGEETSAQHLLALEQANLFVVPLDVERRWYRLHPLIREALLAQMQAQEPERLALLHQRAAQWYAEQQLFPEAITHALEAHDFESAADLIEGSVEPQSWRNPYHSLRGWLSRLPHEMLHTRPQLCVLAALAFYMTTPVDVGSMLVVEAYLNHALQGFQRVANPAGVGSVQAQRVSHSIYQGHFAQAFAQAREALALLPESDVQWRGFGLSTLGLEALMAGELPRAQALLQQALVCHEASGSLGGRQAVALWQAEVSLIQGDRARAAHGFRQILGLADAHPEQAAVQLTDTFGKRRVHIERAAWYGLAGLAFEENRLEEAQQALSNALVEGQFALVHVLSPGLLLQARVLEAGGESSQARSLLLDLEPAAREPAIAREIQLCQAWLARARGDLVALEAWAAGLTQDEVLPLSHVRREEEALLLARLRITQEQPEEAVLLLEPLLEEARRHTQQWSVLQIQVVLALAEAARGKGRLAKQRLLEAVNGASRSRCVRLFLEEGEAMEQALRQLLPDLRDAAQAAYVQALLQAFTPAQRSHGEPLTASAPHLREALTPQEQRVLALLAQGASNQEIARTLVIERSTAKSHVSHLCSKLGARTRTQAIARARELGLL